VTISSTRARALTWRPAIASAATPSLTNAINKDTLYAIHQPRHVTAQSTRIILTPCPLQVIFETFICDDQFDSGEGPYLAADYSLSCNTVTYQRHRLFAGVALVLYPIGK
jgi:hypothetical protein